MVASSEKSLGDGALKKIAFYFALAGATGLLFWAIGVSAAREGDAARFVGNYELVSFEFYGPDGEVRPSDQIGRIVYDEAGNMAAQLMPRNWPEAPEDSRSRYTAYFGTFRIDPDTESVTHSVLASTNKSWVGTDLVRYYEFTDEGLNLSLKRDGRVTGTLKWKRIDGR